VGKNGNLNVIVIADVHGSREAYEKTVQKAKEVQADAICVCGDLTHFGTVKEAEEYLAMLVQSQVPVFFVPGNLDPPDTVNAKAEGATCIHATCKNVKDYSFIGLGALHRAFEVPEDKILQWLQKGSSECQQKMHTVIVSHVPPRDTKVDVAFIGGHAGSRNFSRFIVDSKPVAVFCGHIHEGRGIDHIGNTVIVNPGPARKGYYAFVKLNGKVNVELDRF
jgi:Icc-related predicted phosphoesterase